MSLPLIRAAFETRLKTWADAQTPAIPIAWQNTTFIPPADGSRYIRAALLPAAKQWLSLDADVSEAKGVFQVLFCMPLGTRSGIVEALAESASAAFAPTFTQSTVRVYLLAPMSVAPPLLEADRYVVPLSAPYKVVT